MDRVIVCCIETENIGSQLIHVVCYFWLVVSLSHYAYNSMKSNSKPSNKIKHGYHENKQVF